MVSKEEFKNLLTEEDKLWTLDEIKKELLAAERQTVDKK